MFLLLIVDPKKSLYGGIDRFPQPLLTHFELHPRRLFHYNNRKGADVHSGIPLIRIAITMAYAARAVHPCARFLYWQLPAVAIYWKLLISLAVK
ncbi:hypothetical protein AXL44_004605 [Escherichia coli]|nr:hypothetical protein [Escherichia coli]EFJ7781811.1 hypothetical protein [Escherichia coli]